ncbi:MAG: glycosyltransferase family 4 protein [Acidobacteriota bacterium]
MIHGGAVRIGNLARRLRAAGWRVSFLILVGGTDDPEQRRALADIGTSYFHQKPEMATTSTLLPPEAAALTAPDIAARLASLVAAHRIDVVMLEYAELAAYRDAARPARVVLVEHDLAWMTHARRHAAGFAADGRWLDTTRRRRHEIRACREVDQVHTMSRVDAERLATAVGSRTPLWVIANGVDTRVHRPPTEARDTAVLFVGSFPHRPNLDAFDSFRAEIWPRIRERIADARLVVAGARPPARIVELDGHDGIHVVGEVDDLGPLYRRHAVLVVPLRAGSGTRLKILEALASATPIVTTTIGVEGIDAKGGEHLLVADHPDAFADAVVRVLNEPELGARLGTAGRTLVETHYDWDRIASRLDRGLRALGPFTGPEPRANQPDRVSVLLTGPPPDDRCLDAIEAQDVDGDRDVEIVWCGRAVAEHEARLRDRGVVIVPAEASMSRGRALNHAARVARGGVLVSLVGVPADRAWLSRVLAPFVTASPPAAVQGTVTRSVAGGSRYAHEHTIEAVRWCERHGFVCSLDNLAVTREIWARFPFPIATGALGRRWQQAVTSHGRQILPCWDAVVDAPAISWWRYWTVARSAAAAGERSGIGYGALDVVRDYARLRPGIADWRWRPRSVVELTRPVALWLGATAMAIRRRAARALGSDPVAAGEW